MNIIVEGEVKELDHTFELEGCKVRAVEGGITRMNKLNEGVTNLVKDLLASAEAKDSGELCIVSFADDVKIELDFGPLDDSLKNFTLETRGDRTCIGKAVQIAMGLLQRRKQEYTGRVSYYQPWLIIITDGQAHDLDECREIGRRIREDVSNKKLVCIPVGITADADQTALGFFAENGVPLKLGVDRLKEFFRLVSQTVVQVSNSLPGTVNINVEDLMKPGKFPAGDWNKFQNPAN